MFPISHILPRARALYPDRLAVWDGEKRFSFEELGRRVDMLVGALKAKGVKRGDRVGILDVNSYRYAEAYYACAQAGMILLEPREVLALLGLAVPAAVALTGLLVWPLPGPMPWGALVTELFVGYVLVGMYEWTHFLIHTSHRPRSRYYRSIWTTHRLHHFKNEHYWHGITNTVADRALGTLPDQQEIERSRTARNLDAGRA